jgi:hypothetical protein
MHPKSSSTRRAVSEAKFTHGQISVNFSPEDSQQTVSMGTPEINI